MCSNARASVVSVADEAGASRVVLDPGLLRVAAHLTTPNVAGPEDRPARGATCS